MWANALSAGPVPAPGTILGMLPNKLLFVGSFVHLLKKI